MADDLDFLGPDSLRLSTRPRCADRNAQGEPCGMAPLKGSDRCFKHDPRRAADRSKASRRGGMSRGYGAMGDGSPVPLDSVEKVNAELAKLYGQTAAGLIPPDRARVLNALLGRGLETVNALSFEERLAALEAGQRRAA